MSVKTSHALRQFVVAETGLPSFLRRKATLGKLAAYTGDLPKGAGYGALEAGLASVTGQQQQPLVAMAGVPSSLSQLLVLLEIQSQMQQQSITQAQVIAAQAVYEFTDWYSADLIEEFAHQTSQAVDAVATSMARQTDAYIASLVNWVNDLGGKPGEFHDRYFRTEGSAETGDALRQGDTTHAGVYGRIADAYRWQQHRLDQHAQKLLLDPNPLPPALQTPLRAALQRAHDVAAKDIQLAVRNQTMKTLNAAASQGLIVGYRRVLHPELDRGGVCGLCVAAATRVYRTDHLMALHDDCHCTALPITADHDPGAAINDHDLGLVYQAAGGTTREQLERTQFSVVQHGENGPTLIPKGAPHRTPGMVAKATKPRPPRPDSQTRKRNQLTALHDSLARSLKRVTDELVPADPGKWDQYRQELADRVASLESQLKGGAL